MSKLGRSVFLLIAAAIVITAAVIVIFCFSGNSDVTDTKIGIILTGARDEDGWNGAHYSGALNACREYGGKLIVKENVKENSDQCAAAVNELIDEGAAVIFLSSFSYDEEIEDIITANPNVSFFTTSDAGSIDNLTSYFARMYQARYIAGVIAAAQSETHSLGYAAAERNSEVIRGIDAFTLGAKSYDPDIEVNVIFTGSWDNKEAEEQAIERLVSEWGADVITYHQNEPYAAVKADSMGVYSIGYHEVTEGLSDKYLTSIVLNWDVIYHAILRDHFRGEQKDIGRYWLGIETNAAMLTPYSQAVTTTAKAAAENAINYIKAGNNIFSGLICDNEGNVRCGEDEAISDDILFSEIDWFVQGVNIRE